MNLAVLSDGFLLALSLGLLPYFAFILLTSLAALMRGRLPRDLRPSGAGPEPRRRFLVIVPAHDEEDGIAGTVASCMALDYPASCSNVLVVADNCTDRTAARAREAGARVLERTDVTRRSKGYAIEFLLEVLRQTGELDAMDAIVVVDADSTVHPDLLHVFARGLDAGYEWIQCYDSVGNPDRSWRTRLMAYAFSLINGVTLEGQVALGLSAALRGNGMCLSTRGLRRVPWRTHGLTEDLEYSWSVRLAGGRIAFDRGAAVYATMPSQGGVASENQRQRWESGRRRLRWIMLWPLFRSTQLAPLEKAAALVELTTPTAVSLLVAYLALSLLGAARYPAILEQRGPLFLAVLALCHAVATLALAIHAVSPFLLSYLPWRYCLCWFYMPYYVCWKMLLALRTPPRTWVRTAREPDVHRTGTPDTDDLPKLLSRARARARDVGL
jgi:cellulose synthase/poly-beta-1,6-N-acetylglucosamine synthase-like glycosyltransferase